MVLGVDLGQLIVRQPVVFIEHLNRGGRPLLGRVRPELGGTVDDGLLGHFATPLLPGRRVGCLAGLAHRLYLIDAHDVGKVVPNVGLDVAVDADDLAAIFGLGERVVAVLRLLVEAAKLEHVVFVDRIGADIVDRAGVLGQTDEAEVTDVQGAAPITRDEVGELLVSVQRQADRGRVDDGVSNRVDWAHLQSGVVLDSSSCADSPLRLRLLWRFCS